MVCSPSTAGDFTAVGYFFARELDGRLGVPIGIIKATVGGSPIEAWLSRDSLAADPKFGVVLRRWETMKHHLRREIDYRSRPGGLFETLIRPLQPLTYAGFLWYQGESNAARPEEYGRLFSAMITQWRTGFGQPTLPFIFVQLPNWQVDHDATGQTWALLRAAQASVLDLPATGMVVTIDIGDPALLHPTNKQEVGRRAAGIALNLAYGRKGEDSGPRFDRLEMERGVLRVRFTHADGLHFVGDPAALFEIAGPEGRFRPARGRLQEQSVELETGTMPEPVSVRFEWRNAPAAYLVNRSGLPAAPFLAQMN